MSENGQNTEDVYERVRNAILDGEPRAGGGDVAGRPGRGNGNQPHATAGGAADAPERGAGRGRAQPPRAGGTDVDRRPRAAVRDAGDARGRGAAPVGPADDREDDLARLEGHMAEMAHYARIKDYRRWDGTAQPVPPRPDRARRPACQRHAGPTVRPCRALSPTAHRPRPDRLGDRQSPRRSSTPSRRRTAT